VQTTLKKIMAKNRAIFGGQKIESLDPKERQVQAAKIAPVLRGFCSSERHMVGHFTDDHRVLEYINSNDLEKLAPLGTSCPDHFLRTKIQPLILNLDKK
jgi:rhamnose utilization protein RhaD (predicted bifunctional aldolase and dehydrogenase)